MSLAGPCHFHFYSMTLCVRADEAHGLINHYTLAAFYFLDISSLQIQALRSGSGFTRTSFSLKSLPQP